MSDYLKTVILLLHHMSGDSQSFTSLRKERCRPQTRKAAHCSQWATVIAVLSIPQFVIRSTLDAFVKEWSQETVNCSDALQYTFAGSVSEESTKEEDSTSEEIGTREEDFDELETHEVNSAQSEELLEAAISEVGALCTPKTDHNKGQESATSNLEVEKFQRIKAEAWENILAEEMAQKVTSELGDGFVDDLKDPLELQKVKEEAKTVVRYWLRQRDGVPFLHLQDLYIDYKEAQYNIKKKRN